MALLEAEWFSFSSSVLAEDFFQVVRFSGIEGLSRCYEFKVLLISDQGPADIDRLMTAPATFTIHREDGDVPFHGILSRFDELHAYQDHIVYEAVLVPRLWWLNLTCHNQVFLNQSVKEIIELALQDGGLTSADFEFRLSRDYQPREYVCQYNESHFNFVSRWMEREGIYYFLEQGGSSEKLIMTDTVKSHSGMPQGRRFVYAQPSGLDTLHREEIVSFFTCRQSQTPASLRLKDFNYRTPSVDLDSTAPVSDRGSGEIFIYGEHYRTPEEGRDLARIRAEEYLCRQRVYRGRSGVPFMRPGYTFDLEDHYRSDFNQGYLTIEVEHEGNQAYFLTAGLRRVLSDEESRPRYENRFEVIEDRVQFRPERKAERPAVRGTISAHIDAGGSGQYPEIDDQGRYKIRLPFDLAGRSGGKASCPVRMMQPYGGPGYGFHFPQHKGCEVLLTFVEGNPDRPIIAATVPNPEHASPVTAANATKNVIHSSADNRMEMEDKEGGQRVLLATPQSNTFIRMGSHNDPGGESEDDGFVWSSDKNMWLKSHGFNIKVGGNMFELIVGGQEGIVLGGMGYSVVGLETAVLVGGSYAFNWPQTKLAVTVERGNVIEEQTRILEQRIKAAASEVTAADSKMTAADSSVRAVGQNTRVADEAITAANTATNGEAQALRAADTEIAAGNEEILALGNQITAADEVIEAANTKIEQCGVAIEQIEEQIE
ncbi:MAG: type VI secretion system tip protein VgrG, partial [Proteobacteria bacterium]|nr:type VI secretion system tip protein VgrG [Pseudomonadota bacterium]